MSFAQTESAMRVLRTLGAGLMLGLLLLAAVVAAGHAISCLMG